MSIAEHGDTVILPDAPTIPGQTFRRFRGPADYPALLAVRLAAATADGLDSLSARDPLPALTDIERRYAEVAPGSLNLLVAEVDGEPIGYYNVSWWQEEGGIHVYLHLGWLVPAWRGRGIGDALLHAAEGRCRELAAEHGAAGTVVYATNAVVTEREKLALLREAGYTMVRRLADMALDDLSGVEEPALTPEVEPRPVGPDQYRAIYAMSRDAWTGLWGTTVESEENYQAFLSDTVKVPGFDPSLWRVAWAGEEAVAAVIGRIREGVGIVDYVATRRAWRRRGLARALLLSCLHGFAEKGAAHARLYTNAENSQGARTLYESVGFRQTGEHLLYRKPMFVTNEPSRQ